MKPNAWWESALRSLGRFGDHGPIRRALERVGLVKKRGPTFAEFSAIAERVLGERRKQIPEVWQAADEARRRGGE